MATRNVAVTDHQDEMIETLVQSGRYRDADEVVRAGLRLVEEREAEQAARLDGLRNSVQVGIADLDEGRAIEFESVEALQVHLTAVVEEVVEAERS
jgi:antitoxin ParD1/3/4